MRAADCSKMSAAEKQKAPENPGDSGFFQGSFGKRLRSESNRRWRICNPPAEPVLPEDIEACGRVPTKVPTLGKADGDLTAVVEGMVETPAGCPGWLPRDGEGEPLNPEGDRYLWHC